MRQAEGARAWLLAVVSLVLAGSLAYSRLLWSDAYYDLYAGRYVVTHGIPRENVLTVAAHGAPWIDQQWLAHAACYGAWAFGGYPVLAVFSSALVTGAFAVLGALMLRLGVPPARMFAWTLAAYAVSLGNTEVRAQDFGYLFLALTLWLIVEDHRFPPARKRIWLLVPVLVVWANTYGSVLLGAGLVVAYAAYQAWTAIRGRGARTVPACATLGILAAGSVACNPYGAGVIGYYRRFLAGSPVTRYDAQWWPPRLSDPWNLAFFSLAAVVAIAVVVAWRRGTRPDPVLGAIAAALLALALTTSKDLAWFGFGGSLLAADSLARARANDLPPLGAAFRRAVAAVLAALALVSAAVVAVTPDRAFESGIPVRAIDAAAAAAAAGAGAGAGAPRKVRVLADEWSGTAMLWLHPAMTGRVGFDIRLEQYPAADLSALYAFMFAEGPRWHRLLRAYSVVVVSRRSCPRLARALADLPGWRTVYSDQSGVVVVRRGPR